MAMLIRDLMSLDVSGDFRSDVQLSDMDNPALNEDLLKSYIFTVHAPKTYGAQQRSLSSRDVLDALKTIFTVEREENRVVLTANYGHGKSHLALVLANFFSHPSDSAEVKSVLERLSQALNNESQLAGYRDFKRSKGEFLVVRLQGDQFTDLHEGFVRALEQALREHAVTRSVEIPFWYRQAREWLAGLPLETRHKANDFLRSYNTDVPTLMAELSRHGNYEVIRELVRSLTGIYPDFGRDVSLEEIVVWVIDEVCKTHHMGGLLILFDEFSLFLQKYINSGKSGILQELLNGISKRRGKSAFLAFTQQDVDTIAETYARGNRIGDVRKELERLPKDHRFRLYSLMEGVLSSYFRPNKRNWDLFFANDNKWPLYQARNTIFDIEYFSKRYKSILMWNEKDIDERLVKGCFPLHPMTTAILSGHSFEFGTSENPRTALQFVRRIWNEWAQQPVQLNNGVLNFVFPVALVDFFGEQISKKWHAAYRNALETSPQAISDDHRKVLQALLIQQAVELKASGSDQMDLLYHLSGVNRDIIQNILNELKDQKVIQYNPSAKVYSLWPDSVRPQEVELIIQKAMERVPVDDNLMSEIAGKLIPLEISSLNFGHVNDWSPRQIVLTADLFTVDKLKTMLRPYRIGINGIEDGQRGLVIWLIAQTEEEKQSLSENVQTIFDEAIGHALNPMPVVAILPKRIGAKVIAAARRLKALESLSLSDREQIGALMYQQEKVQAEVDFRISLNEVFGDSNQYDVQRSLSEYVLPAPYHAAVRALKQLSLRNVAAECYRQAYAYRPEFYTQHAVTGKGPNKLREATQKVARWLFDDAAGQSIPNLRNKDIEHQLATLYLAQKWGLLSVGDYHIQVPTSRPLKEAWDLLNKTFEPGCTECQIRDALEWLLNPPYGHDYNTLTLLIVAWMNFHQYELRLSSNGRLIALSELKESFDQAKSPQAFLNQVCTSPLLISRIRANEAQEQVSLLIEQIRQGHSFTQQQAHNALAMIDQFLSNPRLPENQRDRSKLEYLRLQQALESAQQYDRTVSDWLRKIQTSGLDDILKLRADLGSLPQLTIVTANEPSLIDLEKRWNQEAEREIKTFCVKYAQIDDIADYQHREGRLKNIREKIEQFPQLARHVDGAIRLLDQRRNELQVQEAEKVIVAEIKSMASSAALANLYEYQSRLESWTQLSTSTERLRQERLREIIGRIHEYERLVEELPVAVRSVNCLQMVEQVRDHLIRHLEKFRDTQFYQSLVETQQRIDHLRSFFTDLDNVERMLKTCHTPNELTTIEEHVTHLETTFAPWLEQAQRETLKGKQERINALRLQKMRDAQHWLNDIEQRVSNGEYSERLLHQLDNPHPFLASEEYRRLEQIRQTIRQKLDEDVVSRIEALFQRITDPKLRQQCLIRLKDLAGDQ
jgi:hypothetical protein